MARWSVLLSLAVALGACQYPRDVEGTLDRVKGGILHAGVVEGATPWAAVERRLVERFARTLGARVQWTSGAESDLVEALHGRQLDVVAGGFTRRSVWMREVALTRPYLTTKVVVAAPDEATAERLSEDLGGERVAVEAGSPEAAKLEEDTDAIVEPVDDITTVRGPVAVDDFLLDDLGLVATDAELDEHEHALAVSAGENAFLVALERFLLDHEREAAAILAEEGAP